MLHVFPDLVAASAFADGAEDMLLRAGVIALAGAALGFGGAAGIEGFNLVLDVTAAAMRAAASAARRLRNAAIFVGHFVKAVR